jgi:hypothetical protein
VSRSADLPMCRRTVSALGSFYPVAQRLGVSLSAPRASSHGPPIVSDGVLAFCNEGPPTSPSIQATVEVLRVRGEVLLGSAFWARVVVFGSLCSGHWHGMEYR